MIRYVLKRVLLIPPALMLTILAVYILLYILPTSSIRAMPIYAGGDSLDSVFARFNASTNLMTQYLRYCYNIVFRFDFGKSFAGVELTSSLTSYARNTLVIILSCIWATFIAGVPLGVYAATHNNSAASRIITVVSLLLSAIPTYAMALMVALVLVLYLGILPMANLVVVPKSFIMPTLTIALCGMSSIARMTRVSMLEVLGQPFITALRARGLSEAAILYRHSLKNALIPIVAELGRFCSYLLCGAFVVEHFFNVPGLGYFMLRSVGERRHVEILGCTVVMSFFVILINVMFDILYAVINPKIRLRYTTRSSAMKRKVPVNE